MQGTMVEEWLLQGKAALKSHLTAAVTLDVVHLPYNRELLQFIEQQHSTGRPIYLATAADKEVKGKVVSVNVKKMTITVATEDGKKVDYEVNDETKFLGPKGGVSDKGIKDDRVAKDAEVTLIVAGNNRTLHEVRLPERKEK